MVTATLLLAVQQILPWWFALAVVLRDALIVGGAAAYRVRIGHDEMAPSRISKLDTALEFLLLTSVLAVHAGHVADGVWLRALLFATLASIGLSGLHHVLVWGHKAARERGSRASPRGSWRRRSKAWINSGCVRPSRPAFDWAQRFGGPQRAAFSVPRESRWCRR